jgi:fibronectin type 3 domain-containing protein
VYYGTASRVYQQARGSGVYVTASTLTLTDLPAGYSYYFAVTAIDASGMESDYSSEASKSIP